MSTFNGRLHEHEYEKIRQSVIDNIITAGSDREKILEAMGPMLKACHEDGQWWAYF